MRAHNCTLCAQAARARARCTGTSVWLANLEVWGRRFANKSWRTPVGKLAFLFLTGELGAVYTGDKLIHVLNSFLVLICKQRWVSASDTIDLTDIGHESC